MSFDQEKEITFRLCLPLGLSSFTLGSDLCKACKVRLGLVRLALSMQLGAYGGECVLTATCNSSYLPIALLGFLLLFLFPICVHEANANKAEGKPNHIPFPAGELARGAEIGQVHALAGSVVGVHEERVVVFFVFVLIAAVGLLLGLRGLSFLLFQFAALCAAKLWLGGLWSSVFLALLLFFLLFLFLIFIFVVFFDAITRSPVIYGQTQRFVRRE